MADVYKMLVEKLHPLSIGNAYRAYRMAKLLTERLLSLHMDKEKESQKMKEIINEITGDITIHAYPIDRDEAKELGLKVDVPKASVEQFIWQLYEEYATPMKLGQPFHPAELLAGKEMAEIRHAGAYIETTEYSHEFTFIGKVQKTIRNNQSAIDYEY